MITVNKVNTKYMAISAIDSTKPFIKIIFITKSPMLQFIPNYFK